MKLRYPKWLSLGSMAALLLAALPAPAQAPQQKPSIMLIVADDLGYGDTGPYDGGEGAPRSL
jgi:arylsulfatase